MTLEIKVCPTLGGTQFARQPQGDIDLIPSAALRSNGSNELRWAVEEDEDFWTSQKENIFDGGSQDAAVFLPRAFRKPGSRCLVNASAFQPQNIRLYLPLYQTVIIVMPLDGWFDDALHGLHVTEDELVRLARLGRVRFVAPQSVDRYRLRFLSRLLVESPGSLLLSRRLGAAAIVDARHRIPLLYPALGVLERHYLLLELADIAANHPSRMVQMFLGSLLPNLCQTWCIAESVVHRYGAMSASWLGIGHFVAAFLKAQTGRDHLIELSSASTSVEWSSAVGATVVPVVSGTYSEQVGTELCASLYSGLRRGHAEPFQPEMETVLNGILTIDNDAPVLEVVEAISGADVERLQEIVRGISTRNLDPDFLKSAIDRFNGKVSRFERSEDRLKRLKIVALAGIVASYLAPLPLPARQFMSAGFWLLDVLLLGLKPSGKKRSRLLDFVRGLNAWTSSDVVLVSRLSKK